MKATYKKKTGAAKKKARAGGKGPAKRAAKGAAKGLKPKKKRVLAKKPVRRLSPPRKAKPSKKVLAARKAERLAAAKRARVNARRRELRAAAKREAEREARKKAAVAARRRALRARGGVLAREAAAKKQRARIAREASQALTKRHAAERAENRALREERREALAASREQEREDNRIVRRLTESATRKGLKNLHREGGMMVATGPDGREFRPYAVENTRTKTKAIFWTLAQTLSAYVHPDEMGDQYEELDRSMYTIDFFLAPPPVLVPPVPPYPRTLKAKHAEERSSLRELLTLESAQARARMQALTLAWAEEDRAWQRTLTSFRRASATS